MEGGIADDAVWQHCWRRLAAQSASWYATPSGAVGCQFTAILAAELQGVLGRSWNSERPLVFSHVVLTKTLGICRAREIRVRITRRMDLWERGQHVGLVGNDEAEGVVQEVRAASGSKEEDKAIGRNYHDTVLSGKLRRSVCRATGREGGESLLLDNQCTKTGRPVVKVLRKNHPDMQVPPVENPTCAAFEEYEEVP